MNSDLQSVLMNSSRQTRWWRRLGPVGLFVLGVTSLGSGCSPSIDITEALVVTDITTGWFDAGILEDGKNKIVPRISFTLHNALEENVSSVRLLGSFRLVLADGTEDPEELGSSTISAIDLAGLEPGSTTAAFVMQSGLGYTGTQPRLELMEHRLFQDAKLSLFAKHRSDPWLKLGEYLIDRTLVLRGSFEN